MIRLVAALVSTLAVGACAGTPPRSSPERVTDEDIAIYQNGIETGCKDAGRRKGEAASVFCACVMASFKATLSREQWQQAVFAGQHHDDQGEAKVMYAAGKPNCQKGS